MAPKTRRQLRSQTPTLVDEDIEFAEAKPLILDSLYDNTEDPDRVCKSFANFVKQALDQQESELDLAIDILTAGPK